MKSSSHQFEPSLAQRLALWADRLRDVAAMGLRFARSVHDRDAFSAVQQVAIEMMAEATGQAAEDLEPLRATVFAHPTPFAGGDAAIIDTAGRILLIRRADNGLWAMPGGALAVGETPAEGAAREAFEETGVRCDPVALAAVHDSRLCHTPSPHHLYHFTFLCRPHAAGQIVAASHAVEVRETGWFREDGLPPDLDPGHAPRIPHAFRVWHGDMRTYFDGSP